MNKERIMELEALRESAVLALRSAMEVAEVQTDAGTVDPFPDTVVDDRPYEEQIREYP